MNDRSGGFSMNGTLGYWIACTWSVKGTKYPIFLSAFLQRIFTSFNALRYVLSVLDIWKNDGAKTKPVRPFRPEQDNALPVSFLALSSRLVSFLTIIALTKSVLHNPAWSWRCLQSPCLRMNRAFEFTFTRETSKCIIGESFVYGKCFMLLNFRDRWTFSLSLIERSKGVTLIKIRSEISRLSSRPYDRNR